MVTEPGDALLVGTVILSSIHCGFARDHTTYIPRLPSKKPEPAHLSRDGEQVFWPIRTVGKARFPFFYRFL